MFSMSYMVIIGVTTLVGWLLSSRLKSKFKKYSQMPNSSGKSGAEVAKDMMAHYGIHDVKIHIIKPRCIPRTARIRSCSSSS